MTDIIYIRDLKIETLIGVYEWEQRIKQAVFFDLELATDIRTAAQSKQLSDTIDYSQIATRLSVYMSQKAFILIEVLAEEIANLLFQEFNITWLRLRVSKPSGLSNAKEVGVVIERSKS